MGYLLPAEPEFADSLTATQATGSGSRQFTFVRFAGQSFSPGRQHLQTTCQVAEIHARCRTREKASWPLRYSVSLIVVDSGLEKGRLKVHIGAMEKIRISLVTAALLLSTAAQSQVLKNEPTDLPTGKRVLVDDGTCPAGQIKEVIGGSRTAHIARTNRCIPRGGKK
jgi:hypothetical protein